MSLHFWFRNEKHLVRILGACVCWVEGFGVLGFRPRTQLKGVRHKVRDLRDSAPGLWVWKLWDVRGVEMSRSPASCAHEGMTLSRGFVKQYLGTQKAHKHKHFMGISLP